MEFSMKKIYLLLTIIIATFALNYKVNAACTNEDIDKILDKIKVSYVEDELIKTDLIAEDLNDQSEELDDELKAKLEQDASSENSMVHMKEYLYLILVGETYNYFTVKVRNNLTKEVEDALYSSYYNSYYVGSNVHFEPKTYTIEIYGNEDNVCKGELLKTYEYTVPAYNQYASTNYCDNHRDEEICKSNTDTSKMTLEEFDEETQKIDKKNELENMNFFAKCWLYIKKYWLYVFIPVALITLGYLFLVFRYKKGWKNK